MKEGARVMRLVLIGLLAALLVPAPGPAAHAADTVVPFALVDGFCLVNVRLDPAGPDRPFLFDTGMNITAIDSALAAQLSLVVLAEGGAATDVAGAGGAMRIVQIPWLTLGGISGEACPAAAVDLAPLRRQTGLSIQGILGANFLKPFAFTLDYRSRTVTFLAADAPGLAKPPAGAIVLSLFEAPTPFLPPLVPLHIGKAELWGALDSGAAGGLFVPLKVLADLDLPKAERVESRGAAVGGLFGAAGSSVAARLPSVRLGGYEIRRLPVEGTHAEFALLGHDFLRHFRITVDNPRNRALLEPVDPEWSDNVQYFGVAAAAGADGHFRIAGIWAGSPADRAGLQPGERLVRIDGASVDSAGAAVLRRRMTDPAVRTVLLEIEGSSGLRTVRLEKGPRFPALAKGR